ncbi:MAG: TetR/AcrR family transcriptional regulator, partial [Bacteroidota bacterium]
MSAREKIVEKSAELFNTYGYHGCSLSDIMKATNLKKGGIYNHFKSKDEIAIEAFNHNYEKVIQRFKDRLSRVKSKDPIDKLNKVIDAFGSFADDPIVKGGGCPIFNTAMDSTNGHPELRQKARQGIIGLRTYINIKLEEAIDAKMLSDKINVQEVASLDITMAPSSVITIKE